MNSSTPIITEQKMKKIVADLSSRDKRLAKVIASHHLCTIGRNPNPVTHFESLVESVISQQLAVEVADILVVALVVKIFLETTVVAEVVVRITAELILQ
jgi:DNA-3-methyladenine glycosylase II